MSKVYSTGPIENAISLTNVRVSSKILVNILNNDKYNTANVEVTVFSLDETKTQTFIDNIQINPNSSTFRVIDVSKLFEFEVQTKVENEIYDVLTIVEKI